MLLAKPSQRGRGKINTKTHTQIDLYLQKNSNTQLIVELYAQRLGMPANSERIRATRLSSAATPSETTQAGGRDQCPKISIGLLHFGAKGILPPRARGKPLRLNGFNSFVEFPRTRKRGAKISKPHRSRHPHRHPCDNGATLPMSRTLKSKDFE